MRFAIVALFATVALALPAQLDNRSLVTDVGNLVGDIVQVGADLPDITKKLVDALGDRLKTLENAMGIPFAEFVLHLRDEGATSGAIQAIGQAIAMVINGTGLDEVNQFLNKATGGKFTDLAKCLGVPDVKKALGLE